MLILSRRQQDKIIFPDLGISIEVIKVKGNRASLGIDAPRDVRIARHELIDEEDFPLTKSAQEPSHHRGEHDERIAQATKNLRYASQMIHEGETHEGLSQLATTIDDLDGIVADTSRGKSAERTAKEPREIYALSTHIEKIATFINEVGSVGASVDRLYPTYSSPPQT